MKNTDLINKFILGEEKGKIGHLFIENNVLYNYGYHFPISLRVKGENGFKFVVNLDKYSQTTSKIQNQFKRMAEKDIIAGFYTEDLKDLIFEKPQNIEELNKLLVIKGLNKE